MRQRWRLLVVAAGLGVGGCAGPRDGIYQVSTLNALVGGVLDGDTTLRELRRHGGFGIGTFNGVDGEMVLLDGVFYRLAADGRVSVAAPAELTPFAAVTDFRPEKTLDVAGTLAKDEFYRKLEGALSGRNVFYAVRVEGVFKYVKVRSVPKQKRPYPTLTEVTKTQPVFELRGVRGTLVGFRFPGYVGEMNFPGYHLHFITDDRSAGGHVLDFETDGVRAALDDKRSYSVDLPAGLDFAGRDLSDSGRNAIEKVEK